MSTIILDIETIAPTDNRLAHVLARFERDYTCPKTHKKPEAQAAHKEAKLFATLDRLPLTHFASIACIGVRVMGSGHGRIFGQWDYPDSLGPEWGMLDAFTQWVNEREESGRITWAGKGIKRFDLPLIRTRMIAAGYQRAQRQFAFKRYDTEGVIDLEDPHYFPAMGVKGPSVAEMFVLLGIDPPAGHGSEVAGWWATGDHDSIARHCLSDLEVEEQVLIAVGEG